MPETSSYKTYSEFLAERFPWKMQKLSVNVGFTCPNRDGSIGTGGCTYCNNDAFVPRYCSTTDPVAEQLRKGKDFFGRKYPDMHYMAYFQAYTSTYSNVDTLLRAYAEALNVDAVEALVIATRPDCLSKQLLTDLKRLSDETGARIMFEIGVESSHDATLAIVNRGHTWARAQLAIDMIAQEGFDVCAHLIFGLPGETLRMMLQSVDRIVAAPVTSLKFHQLQVIKGTPMHRQWELGEVMLKLFGSDEYLALCEEVIDHVPHHIAIERFTASTPSHLLVAPRWNLKNYQFVNLLNARIKGTSRSKK